MKKTAGVRDSLNFAPAGSFSLRDYLSPSPLPQRSEHAARASASAATCWRCVLTATCWRCVLLCAACSLPLAGAACSLRRHLLALRAPLPLAGAACSLRRALLRFLL